MYFLGLCISWPIASYVLLNSIPNRYINKPLSINDDRMQIWKVYSCFVESFLMYLLFSLYLLVDPFRDFSIFHIQRHLLSISYKAESVPISLARKEIYWIRKLEYNSIMYLHTGYKITKVHAHTFSLCAQSTFPNTLHIKP